MYNTKMNKLKSFSSTQDIQLYQEIKLLPAGSVFPFAKNNLLNLYYQYFLINDEIFIHR